MKADFKDDYYYITSDSLFGEDSSIIRVKKEEFESFIYENYTKEFEEKARKYDELFKDGFLQKVLLGIGLALNATHNTVTTDVPELCIEDDVHWRIDNSVEINELIKLGKIIKTQESNIKKEFKSFEERFTHSLNSESSL